MQDKMIALVKLQTPPLLNGVQLQNGKKLVNNDQKQSLEKEQAAFIASVQAMSADCVILYRYKMVLNAVAVIAPKSVVDKLNALGTVAYLEGEGSFALPVVEDEATPQDNSNLDLKDFNSVKFIGAEEVHQMKLKGKDGKLVNLDGTGMRVGIIDTGVDYTHSMLLGAGTAAAYQAIDPAKPTDAFPNQKVVGGIDLVGSDYNSGSGDMSQHFPIPDSNPLDEQGHGSHVAGTVAGLGDGINSYSGVAPGASLYAIKVFGKVGSTGDAVVIAALEYAADPTGSADPSQALDVVNLSLGGSFGSPHVLYSEAVQNLTSAGTVVVAAAGNEGHFDYIVGAPSVSTDALSVAASIDNGNQNWHFSAVVFHTPNEGDLLAEAIASPVALPLDQAAGISGSLVLGGLAAADYDPAASALIKGHVVLIDRGVVSFDEKFTRAQNAGAIGIVVADNKAEEPFAMGGNGKYTIPAVLISQAMGASLKADLAKGPVTMSFHSDKQISKPQLIDTITDFSSMGPRTLDGFIKPEIAAPGLNVVSVAKGSGNQTVQLSGTSMATPHMTGVMALLKQLHPDLSVAELKTLAMETAKQIADVNKMLYPVSLQGAGRVQLTKAVNAKVLALPGSISLGEQNLDSVKTVMAAVNLKNISQAAVQVTPTFVARSSGLQMSSVPTISLAVGETKTVLLRFTLIADPKAGPIQELDGFLHLAQDDGLDLTVPVLAVSKRISQNIGTSLIVHSSLADSAGAVADLSLSNQSHNAGQAYIFNLLGEDSRPAQAGPTIDSSCSLQSAGYRILDRIVDGNLITTLQIAVKLYHAQTTWNPCEISVLIDKDGDGIPDQELAGIADSGIGGLLASAKANSFHSVLLDAAKARDLRKQYELASAKDHTVALKEDYTAAMLDSNPMTLFENSSIAIIEAPVADLALTSTGLLSVRVAVSGDNNSGPKADSFLEQNPSDWTSISVQKESQSFYGMPETVSLGAGASQSVSLVKGFGDSNLLLLFPQNANVNSDLITDSQSQTVKPQFQ